MRTDILLVDDKGKARNNRERIADKSLNREWWNWYYGVIETCIARKEPIPPKLLADLPNAESIGYGFHEVNIGDNNC